MHAALLCLNSYVSACFPDIKTEQVKICTQRGAPVFFKLRPPPLLDSKIRQNPSFFLEITPRRRVSWTVKLNKAVRYNRISEPEAFFPPQTTRKIAIALLLLLSPLCSLLSNCRDTV